MVNSEAGRWGGWEGVVVGWGRQGRLESEGGGGQRGGGEGGRVKGRGGKILPLSLSRIQSMTV